MKLVKEARRMAWETAAFAAHVKDTMSIPDLESPFLRPKYKSLKVIANTLRDLADALELSRENVGKGSALISELHGEICEAKEEVEKYREAIELWKHDEQEWKEGEKLLMAEIARLRTEVEVLSGPWNVYKKRVKELEAENQDLKKALHGVADYMAACVDLTCNCSLCRARFVLYGPSKRRPLDNDGSLK